MDGRGQMPRIGIPRPSEPGSREASTPAAATRARGAEPEALRLSSDRHALPYRTARAGALVDGSPAAAIRGAEPVATRPIPWRFWPLSWRFLAAFVESAALASAMTF